MWKNFFNVAIRNITKYKVFSYINIVGLAIGLASAILIILFIVQELSFDRFHEHRERIYRICIEGKIGSQQIRSSLTSYAHAPGFYNELKDGEIEQFVRMEEFPQLYIWSNGAKEVENNIIFADSSFFRVFSINLVRGDADHVLRYPNSVVLTRSKAIQYFGNDNPLGEVLQINEAGNEFIVTGVMQDFPANSHFTCDFLISMNTNPLSRTNEWLRNSIHSYILVDPKVDKKELENKINAILYRHAEEQLRAAQGITLDKWEEGGNAFEVFLQPLTDIHLDPSVEITTEGCFRPVNDKKYIYIFSIIAFFILVIASINFMNLSTARSAVRAREIGIRKVVGSDRSLLIRQFLSESVVLSLIALIIAVFVVEITLPLFNRTIGMSLDFNVIGKGKVIAIVVSLSVLVGFLSGTYPAFYLSRYKPLQGLTGGSLRGVRSTLFRRTMVVVQFTISVSIIVGTLVVARQVGYLLNKNPGFDAKQIIVLDRITPLGAQIDLFCDLAEEIPGVEKASNSTTYLGFSNYSSTYQVKGQDRSISHMFDVNFVDPDFFETYGLKLVNKKGRFFNELYRTTVIPKFQIIRLCEPAGSMVG